MSSTSTSSLQARLAGLRRLPYDIILFLIRESLFCWILDGEVAVTPAPRRQCSVSFQTTWTPKSDTLRCRTSDKSAGEKSEMPLPSPSCDTQSLSLSIATRRCISAPSSSPPSPACPSRKSRVRPDFQQFCDNLLEAKRLREQEKEIGRLQGALAASKRTHSRSTFDTFCQQVLLTTELSRKKKEARELREEVNAHEQRRAEEKEARGALDLLRGEHEREVRVITNEWRKENTMLRREVELLKLSQATHSLEQEISSELEDRLFELQKQQQRESQSAESLGKEVVADEGYSTDDTEAELENMTVMSSTSTYVGSPSPSRMKKSVRLMRSSTRRGADGFVGFSFNPLFYGPQKTAARRRQSAPMASCVSRPPWK